MNVTFRLMNDGMVGPSETLEFEDCADLEREGRSWATGQQAQTASGHSCDFNPREPMAAFIEATCVFTHEGRSYEAGGAWIADCTDGYSRGVVYVKPQRDGHSDGAVTDWHGNFLAVAEYGPRFQGPFCRMRCVSFTFDGVRYYGRYCPDWSDAVRVRSTKPLTRGEP